MTESRSRARNILRALTMTVAVAAIAAPAAAQYRNAVETQIADLESMRDKFLSLAEAFHVKGYACAAGGCLLTDPSFGRKIKELLEHDPDFSINDTHLLKFGRHFRLDPATKAVVGRIERENSHVRALAGAGDAVLFATAGSSPASSIFFRASSNRVMACWGSDS